MPTLPNSSSHVNLHAGVNSSAQAKAFFNYLRLSFPCWQGLELLQVTVDLRLTLTSLVTKQTLKQWFGKYQGKSSTVWLLLGSNLTSNDIKGNL